MEGSLSHQVSVSTSRRLRVLVAAGWPVGLVASAGYAAAGGAPTAELVAIGVISASFTVAGLIAWGRRPANRTGRLMVLAGLCQLLVPLVGPPTLVLAPVGHAAGITLTMLLGYLILAFPSGELSSRSQRAAIAVTGTLVLAARVGVQVSLDPATRGWSVENPYRIIHDPGVATALEQARLAIVLIVVAIYLGLVLARWARATGPARRVFLPVLLAGIAVVVAYVASATISLLSDSQALRTTLLWGQDLGIALFPVGFLVGFLRSYLARSAIADLVVELGETPAPARLRGALANALGDPTLDVAYWSPEARAYVDLDGLAVDLPGEGSGRAVTCLERDGAPIAAILHDPALLDDPGLVASVASAMRLAVENERLQAEVEARLDEVRASRARIVEAGDLERRRLERDLHDGAQQRLVALAISLREARSSLPDGAAPRLRGALDAAAEEVRGALAELRELARGIHPAILTEAGLGAAVGSVADRSAVPVDVEGATDERFAPVVERTAYFFVSEALANVNKHAGASRAAVRIARSADRLTVEVRDDGAGGADATQGSGLRGLTDRLAAVDGTLEIESPPGGGTRLLATIPFDASPANQG